MKLLLVTRTQRPEGRVAQTRKTIEVDWVRVGRNASCEIHLPDARVALEQGMIVNRDGLVYLEGEAGSQDITRKSVRSVRMKPGEPIDVGPYRLEAIPAPEGYDGAVSVEKARDADVAPDFASRVSRTTLRSIGMTKRRAAWISIFVIAVLFFLVPAGRVLDLPWREAAMTLGIGDRFWNPGPLMLGHQPIAAKCAACHEVAFQQVKDRACLKCHEKIGEHVAPAMHPAALFEGARCASCHREHKGAKATHRDDDGMCIACHRDIHAKARDAKSGNVSDFAKAHPKFRLTLPTGGHGLKFPHAVHLDRKGVKSPGKGRVVLECASCHKPDSSGRLMQPIRFEKQCQECHRLDIEPAVMAREVPHGDPAAVAAMIDEFYANLALKGTRDSFQKAFGVPGEGLLRRAGAASEGEREDALRMASRKAAKVTAELFDVRVCATCHEVSHAKDWKIAPVRASNRWMPGARFDHKAHASAKCADCHDVAMSKTLRDVSMPSIETCRECHAGSAPTEKKVTSNCLLCHGFHDPRYTWGADAK